MKHQMIRFLITGMINTLFYYLLYTCFIYMGTDYRLAVLMATLMGVLFSFMTLSKYVFNNRRKTLIFLFIANYAAVYFLNIFLIHWIHWVLKCNLYWSGFIALIPATVVSFLVNKHIVFKQKATT